MRQKVGPTHMRKFLASEMNRCLPGRATEQEKELPLSRVEGRGYIHYAKGSVAMYALADDMLNRIVIYDNRVIAATAKPLPAGRYEVTVKVLATKRVADELGKERDVPLDDLIDIGVLDAKGEPIVLTRERVDRSEGTYTFTVDRRPAKAGIDPLNKLIDRKPDDNTMAVTVAGG
jgi:hypothetical protein